MSVTDYSFKTRASCAGVRAGLVGAPGRFSGPELKALMYRQLCKCANCKTSILDEFHTDHVLSLRLGGSNFIDNIQLLCPPCHLRKGDGQIGRKKRSPEDVSCEAIILAVRLVRDRGFKRKDAAALAGASYGGLSSALKRFGLRA